MNNYKSFDELKKELDNKFEIFLYNANIELLEEKEQLKSQLQQKNNAIDECIEFVEKLRMEKWSIIGTDIMELLEKLQQAKGDIDGSNKI